MIDYTKIIIIEPGKRGGNLVSVVCVLLLEIF